MMKRVLSLWSAGLLAAGLFLLAGCATYDASLPKGGNLAGVKRFFVVSNQNDNHALDHQIEAALKVRNREAATGPLTMMPEDAQAIVAYDDHWTWDFGDHLVYLQLSVRDRKTGQPLGTARFSTTVPRNRKTADVISELADRLLASPAG